MSVCLLLSTLLIQTEPSPVANHVDELAARVALLMLRASLPDSGIVDNNTILVGDQRVAMGLTEAIGFLTGLPKPTRCEATKDGPYMVVGCDSIRAGDEAYVHAQKMRALEDESGFWGSILKDDLGGRRDARVLVVGSGEFVVVPFEAVERYERHYLVAMPLLTLSGELPHEATDLPSEISEELLSQVSYVVVANRSEELPPGG